MVEEIIERVCASAHKVRMLEIRLAPGIVDHRPFIHHTVKEAGGRDMRGHKIQGLYGALAADLISRSQERKGGLTAAAPAAFPNAVDLGIIFPAEIAFVEMPLHDLPERGGVKVFRVRTVRDGFAVTEKDLKKGGKIRAFRGKNTNAERDLIPCAGRKAAIRGGLPRRAKAIAFLSMRGKRDLDAPGFHGEADVFSLPLLLCDSSYNRLFCHVYMVQ